MGAMKTCLRCLRAQQRRRLSFDSPQVQTQSYSTTPAFKMPQRSIPASYYRGGTSRALIFQPHHLPVDRSAWGSIFLQLMGSPDPYGRQLDGMGAGISSLSKICIIAPSTRDDADIDYTFVGIGIERDEVDMAGNCGNMSSAVGPYAINEGLVHVEGGGEQREATVRIRNTNTGVVIRSTFPVVNGQAEVKGDYAIDGVAGTSAKIRLDFLRPGGAKTGLLLPTGKVVDRIKGIEVSLVDAANPCVFVRAEDVGVLGTILPGDFNKLPEKLALLDEIRRIGAVTMGMVKTKDEVPRTIPKVGIVSRARTHTVLSGETVAVHSVDVVLRFISDEQPHRAIPLTAALCTAVASKIKGSIVEQYLSSKPVNKGMVTIGHTSGRIQVDATMDENGEAECATVFRTARRIFDGKVYYNA